MKNKILIIITIFIILFSVGCKKEEKKPTKQEETKTIIDDNINQEVEVKENNEELKVELKVDNTKTMVLYHDNKKITKYELYINYNNESKAKEEYKKLVESKEYSDNPEILDFYTKDNYIKSLQTFECQILPS